MPRAGVEPATCRLGVDNGNVAGPQQKMRDRRGRGVQSGSGVEPHGLIELSGLLPRGNRAAPARDEQQRAGPPGFEPGPARLELAMLPLTPQACGADDPARTGPSGDGAPVLFRLSYIRIRHARLESNQRPLPSQSSALPLSYERELEPPAGVEPAPRPYKGRVLAVDTTEAERHGDGRESNPHPPRCKRGARPVELHPQGQSADGWSRTTTARGGRVTAC